MSSRRIVFILLCCGCVTISFNVSALRAVLPEISLELGISDLLSSKVLPFYMIPYGLGALIYAPLSKRFSYKRILVCCYALYACASLFCAMADSIYLLLAGRVAMGITGASAIPLGLMIIGELFEKNIRGRLVGIFFGCSFFSYLSGILVGGFASWRLLFFIPAIIGGMNALLLGVLKIPELAASSKLPINYLKVFKEKKIRDIFIYIFVISLFYQGVTSWFGIYLARVYGLQKSMISVFFIFMTVGGALGQNIGGFISDKRSRYMASLTGLIVLSLATMCLLREYPLYILCAILTIMTTGWTIGHNGISTILTDFPQEFRPEIASLNSSVRFVAGGIGFAISSLFVAKSFALTFFGLGCLMLLSAFYLKRTLKVLS